MARIFSSTSKGVAYNPPVTTRKAVFPVQVMEVLLSESHPEYKNTIELQIGAIRGRRYDSERGTPTEDLPWYNPLDPSDLKIPLIGEAVLLIESPGAGIASGKSSIAYRYISTVGISGQISNNASPTTTPVPSKNPLISFVGNMGSPDIPEIGLYAPDIFIPPLVAFEGDRIIQGRWGNAIRFSNTSFGSEDKSFWNSSGTDGDPITIISNGVGDPSGLMRSEDLNNGSSNIILSSTQQLDMESSNKLPVGYKKLNQYAGSQIVLSSDKIVLNSMEDSVVISGKKGVSISTPEWKADITKLCDILEDLISEVSTIAQGTGVTTSGAGGPFVTPFITVIPKLAIITTKLNALKQ